MKNKYYFIFWIMLLSSQINIANAELNSHLQQLKFDFQAHKQQNPSTPYQSDNAAVHVISDYVVVDMTIKGDIEKIKPLLSSLGMVSFSQYKQRLSGALPIEKLDELEKIVGISWVTSAQARTRRSAKAQPRSSGFVFNAADPAMFTDVVRKQYNVTGKGVSIGVLSDSYNCLGTAKNDVATGDLPTDVLVLKEYPVCSEGLSDEGRAMMQLIHDVAPEAKLIFYTAFVSPTDFAQGIFKLAEAGAQVIVDDIGWLTMPMFQEGPIAQAVNEVTAAGVSYFSAAGNSARLSYENDFVPGIEPLSNDRAHDFGTAAGGSPDFYQLITVPAGQSIRISLQWDDPSEISGGLGAKTDLDMFLLDSSLKRVVRTSEDNNIGHDPVEFLSYQTPSEEGFETNFNLYISHRAGPVPKHLKYILFTAVSDNGTQPNELLVLNTESIQFFFTEDNTLMDSGQAVVAPFSPTLQDYLLVRVDNKFLTNIADGRATLNFSGEDIQIGPGALPIWHVPEGFFATVLPDGRVELFAEDDENATAQIQEYRTNSSTTFGHPNASGAIAVGAINYQQTPWFNTSITSSFVENFSSAGGTPILFSNSGIRLAKAEYRSKPEIIAPDGSDTTFFPLGDIERTDSDGNQLPNFFGTSAAAPHAAAMAALLLEAFPQLTPIEVKQAMLKGTVDLPNQNQGLQNIPEVSEQPCRENIQFDFLSGCGLIQADLVFEQVDKNTDDVSLTLEPSTELISAGIAFKYHFKLLNFSDVDLRNVRIRVLQFPDHLEFQGIEGCIDLDEQEVSCKLETVNAGETRNISLSVMPRNNPEGRFIFRADLLTDTNINLTRTKINLETKVSKTNGDFNFDGCIDLSDWGLLFAALRSGGSFDQALDLNADGFIGLTDLTILETLYSNPPSGKACQ